MTTNWKNIFILDKLGSNNLHLYCSTDSNIIGYAILVYTVVHYGIESIKPPDIVSITNTDGVMVFSPFLSQGK
jgi:hypothetical protein